MAFATQLPVVVQADVLAVELHVWLAANSDGETLVPIRASSRRAAGDMPVGRVFMGTSWVFIGWDLRSVGLSCW
jgi:hypothetical protein